MAVRVRRSETVRRRIERFLFVIAACYGALVVRLVYLQTYRADYYREWAQKVRGQVIPLPAERGAILDRDGRPLAITTHTGVLVCDPTLVTNAPRAAARLAPILQTRPEQVLPGLLPRKVRVQKRGQTVLQDDRFVVLRENMGPEAVEAFRAARAEKDGAQVLAGLSITDRPERAYPAGRDAAHLIGFLIPDAQGRFYGVMGLEKSLEMYLRGQDGQMRAEVDARRRVIPDTNPERREAVDGLDVRLTLDSTIQHIVESELAACYEKNRPVGATAIVMDPKTGDILALVSYPNFDPINRAELKKNPEALRDRALNRYEPGSTMKPITAVSALDAKAILATTTFYCRGHLPIGRRTINCVLHGDKERYGHGTETVRDIICHSCNIGAAQIGMRLKMDRMADYLERFGFLEKTGIGLPSDTAGTLGFGAEGTRGGAAKVARVAFGQSVMVTPLAMAVAYAAIANHGVLMRPRLIQSCSDSNGRVVKTFPPERLRQVVSPEAAAVVCSGLEAVVKSGTGKGKAEVAGYTVAGKTGTAQKVAPGERGYSHSKYVASFIGFLPARNPRAVIAVVVDEPKASIYGAQVAAPVFQAIGRQLMWYWKVPPDDPSSLVHERTAHK